MYAAVGPSTMKAIPSHGLVRQRYLVRQYWDSFLRTGGEQRFMPRDGDYVFASFKNKGATPRTAGILIADYLKKAALDLGLIKLGERFGGHNLRHSLATFLVALKTDPKTVQ